MLCTTAYWLPRRKGSGHQITSYNVLDQSDTLNPVGRMNWPVAWLATVRLLVLPVRGVACEGSSWRSWAC